MLTRDYSKDAVEVYADKILDLAREMGSVKYGHREGEIASLLKAAAMDLKQQNQLRGGFTAAALVRPEAIQAFAEMSPTRHAALWPKKELPKMAAAAAGQSSDPLIRHLHAIGDGSKIEASSATAMTTHLAQIDASAREAADRLMPVVEAFFASAGEPMPLAGKKLQTHEVEALLTKANVRDMETRMVRKRQLERVGLF